MTRAQYLALLSGLAVIGLNLLFPRSFHGNRYHFAGAHGWYDLPEMVIRGVTLLLLLVVVLLFLRSRERALNVKQKIVLAAGSILWLLILLYNPNAWLEFDWPYYAPYWDARVIDYSFSVVLWVFILGYAALLTPIFAYPLTMVHKGLILSSFGIFLIGQMAFAAYTREDEPIFGLPFLCAGLIGTILLWITLVTLKKQSRGGDVATQEASVTIDQGRIVFRE